MAKGTAEVILVGDREVTITNPDKVFFPEAQITKGELVHYYLTVCDGVMRGIGRRPMALKRFPNGIHGKFFFQKRAPESRPEWVETTQLRFPSGRTADEVVVSNAAQLAWIINLGCVDLNPHPVRVDDLDHPDELRIDLDPVPGVSWDDIRRVALVACEVLVDHGLVGWPKTSGSRGIHINVRIAPKYTFTQVRRAALTIAREVERRAPKLATSEWWKENRHGVFLDYNQNAKDRTVASAYSVRPVVDARVSAPVSWEELVDCDPADFTVRTMVDRFGRGDPSLGIDECVGLLEPLLERAKRHEAEGLGDAPWPPHFDRQEGEAPRVRPSASKKPAPSAAKKSPGRKPTKPLLVIARAADKDEALAGLERWKHKHPEAAAMLHAPDILVDSMRGRSTTWTRIRINLEHVDEPLRPEQEAVDPDYDPWSRG